MRKFYYSLGIAFCIFLTSSVQAQQSFVQKEVKQGVLRIKFVPKHEKKLDAFIQDSDANGQVSARTGQTFVSVGIEPVDKISRDIKAISFKRVFRPAGKNEMKHREFGLHLWYEVEYSSQKQVDDIIKRFQSVADIEVAEGVLKAERKFVGSPRMASKEEMLVLNNPTNDSQFSNQWHYKNTGQQGGTAGRDISLEQAWTIETGNSQVIVAIEDGGVDVDHPDLAGNMWVNPGEISGNGIDDDNNGFIDDIHGYNFADDNGVIPADDHGTHVAGTVAAETNNGIGVAGVAGGSGSNDGVRIMSCAVFGASGNGGGFAEAYVYAADNGAVISQNSWGYTSKGVYEQAVLDAIDYFNANAGGSSSPMNGGLVIFAAGNSESSGQWYPGYYSATLSVSATNNKDVKAWYSNYDTWVDIAAPGGETFVNNDPKGVLSTLPNGNYGYFQGTSMACPHVSGVAALIVSNNIGNITPSEVWSRLVNNTDYIDDLNPSYAGRLGSGRLNAYAALTGTTPPPPPASYCASNGNNVSDEWIGSVSFSNLSNSSGASSGGYADYTSQTANVSQNNAYTITISPSWSGTVYNEGYSVWIDYNQDADFNDAGEQVFTSGPHKNSTVSGNISIPSGALEGETRMRVSMKYNGIPTSCESFSYGEVEDYTVNISAGTATCNTPGSRNTSNISTSGATLSWGSVSGAQSYTVRYRATGTSSWTTSNSASTSISISGLSDDTGYEWQVRTNCSGLSSSYSSSESFTTLEVVSVSYCASGGNNSSYEWIDLVELNGMVNSSGNDGGYEDNTGMVANVQRGASSTIYVSAGFSSSSYTEYWRIWIDFNQDGDFADSGELLVSGSSSSSARLSATLSIPSSAALGQTRMRVTMKYNSTASSCESFSYGEVEDYTVNISNTGGAAVTSMASANPLGNEEPLNHVLIYPNPASNGFININTTRDMVTGPMILLNVSGQHVLTLPSTERKINVGDLSKGIYYLQVPTEKEMITRKVIIN